MGPSFLTSSRIEPKITIEFQSLSELQDIESALQKIKSGRNGHHILSEVARVTTHEKNVLIRSSKTQPSETGGELTDLQENRFRLNMDSEDADYMKKLIEVASNGEGVRSVITYNPTVSVLIDRHQNSWVAKNGEQAFISLAHELVHSFYLLTGTSKATGLSSVYDIEKSQLDEENRATGTGNYFGSTFSENGVRQDHGLPLRASYFTKNDFEP